MPILTKASITKGTPSVFTLDKDALALHPTVVADVYFSNVANWKHVSILYKSANSYQSKLVLFDVYQNSVVGDFKTSLFAEDVFAVQSVTIHDFDGGELLLPRSSLTVAEFDVDMIAAASSFSWNNIISGVSTSGNGQLSRTFGSVWTNLAYSDALVGDFTLSAILDSASGENVMFGYSKQIPVSFGSPSTHISSSMYSDMPAGTIGHYAGNTGTPSSSSAVGTTPTSIAQHTFEIKRIGSSIVAKADGVTIFTDNFAGPVFPTAMLYSGGSLLSTSVI